MPNYHSLQPSASRSHPRLGSCLRRGAHGFTLLELLVVMAVMGILMGVGASFFQATTKIVRLESRAQQVTSVLQRARMEAVKRQVVTYVEIDATSGNLLAYADLHDQFGEQIADYRFNPVIGKAERETDYLITSFALLPATFSGPVDAADMEDREPTAGLSLENGRRIAIFDLDGSLRDTGSFRITSADGLNTLEVALNTRSGLVETRKYIHDISSGAGYYGRSSSNGREDIWVWY